METNPNVRGRGKRYSDAATHATGPEVAQTAGNPGRRPSLEGPDGAHGPFPKGRSFFIRAEGGLPPILENISLQCKLFGVFKTCQGKERKQCLFSLKCH